MNVKMKMVDIDGNDKGRLLVVLFFSIDFENNITEGLFSTADEFVDHPDIAAAEKIDFFPDALDRWEDAPMNYKYVQSNCRKISSLFLILIEISDIVDI